MPMVRIPPPEALRIMMMRMAPPRGAQRLTEAMHDEKCHIWRDGELVPREEVWHLSVLENYDEETGQYHPLIGDDRWNAVPGEYEFDADEVMKLSQEAEAVQTAAAAAEEARAEAATARAKLEQARAELQAAIERVKQAEARAEAASTATDNSRRRDPPGPKPTDDWPEKVKAELLRIALTDPKALHKPNYDALNRQIRKRFGDTNRWLPKDPKETEKIIREFLQRLH
jgi:hypothetical protein